MSRTTKKGVYTANEIAEILIKKFPGRFKDLDSAKRRVHYARARLGIEDINGKRNFMQFSRNDTERIIEDIALGKPCTNGKTRKPARKAAIARAQQVSLFDALTDESIIDWLDPYTLTGKKTELNLKDEPMTKDELVERIESLFGTLAELITELGNRITEE